MMVDALWEGGEGGREAGKGEGGTHGQRDVRKGKVNEVGIAGIDNWTERQ